MLKARNIFFQKNHSKDTLFLLNLAREMFKKNLINNKLAKKETQYFKNYIIYSKNEKNRPSIIVEKTLQKYDKYDKLNSPSDLFINLPMITELNILVKTLKDNKTKHLIDAITNKEKYIIEPFNIYALENDENNKKYDSITLEIPEEYQNQLIYQRSNSENDPLLSNVQTIIQSDMNEFIIKLKVDPLLLG